MKSASAFAVTTFSLLLAVVVFDFPAAGQGTRSISSTGRRIDEINRQAAKAERDELNRELSGNRPTREALKVAAAKNAEIREDLANLQAEYNKIVLKIQMREAITDAFGVEAGENLQRYANRLKSNIVFPEKKKDESEKVTAEPDISVKASLVKVCQRIYDFITSPAIENPAVLDIEAAVKARDALDDIARISERLQHPSTREN